MYNFLLSVALWSNRHSKKLDNGAGQMEDELKVYELKPISGNDPAKMVILLHGLGADGQDLIELAPVMAQGLGDVVFIAPDAPYPCDMAPMGRQWYSLQDWTPESMQKGAAQVFPLLDEFILLQLQRYGLKYSDLVLSGFSQGAMMALYAGLRQKEKVAGILGFSGWLPESDNILELNKVPVHLVHGEEDQIVPFQAWRNAIQMLEVAEFDVSGKSVPGLAHGIDPQGIDSGIAFLKKLGF